MSELATQFAELLRPPWILTSLVALAGCASGLGVEALTGANAEVATDHYSFTAPVGEGWYLVERTGGAEPVVIRRSTPTGITEIRFLVDAFTSPITQITANIAAGRGDNEADRECASLFQNDEKRIMYNMGVEPGLYELDDIETSEIVIGGKTFHVMEYRRLFNPGEGQRVFGGRSERAALYLYFPPGPPVLDRRPSVFVALHRTLDTEREEVDRIGTDNLHAALETLLVR